MKRFKPLQPWRLYCPQLNLWAGLDSTAQIVPCASPDDPRVQVFDEWDNQAMKIKFYSLITGINWTVKEGAR